jgi:hypothetical protein
MVARAVLAGVVLILELPLLLPFLIGALVSGMILRVSRLARGPDGPRLE